jgi:O-antigen/teichoic acid export membrane protein
MTLSDMHTAEEDHSPDATLPADRDSLRKRYGYKLSANLLGLGISAITQAIIPRGLGPKAYGDFNFLTNFFTQVVSFLEMGTGTAYYTKLSQRQGESSLVTFYCHVSVVISVITLGAVLLPIATATQAMIWPDQALSSVFLAAVFGILSWMVTILNSMADAYGITVRAEVSRIVQKIAGLFVIVIMLRTGILDLSSFFFYHYALLLLLASLLVGMIRSHVTPWQWRLPLSAIKTYAREFYQYSNPLFTYFLVALPTGLFDRWMLQTFSGSEEQGFYGLSFQVGALCFLFTGAMTPLFMRELAIAFGNRDSKRMADLFHRQRRSRISSAEASSRGPLRQWPSWRSILSIRPTAS